MAKSLLACPKLHLVRSLSQDALLVLLLQQLIRVHIDTRYGRSLEPRTTGRPSGAALS